MALGKAAKRKRKIDLIIQQKLENKILTNEYYKDFKKELKKHSDKDKFKMFVYAHPLFGGIEKTKKEWLEWIEGERKTKLN